MADLNGYRDEADGELGFDYVPVPRDRISSGRDGVLCNQMEIAPADIADDAFVDSSCSEDILVAYDPAYLDISLARADAALAHEWGHLIHAQAADLDLGRDPDGLPIDAELQADCPAGVRAAKERWATSTDCVRTRSRPATRRRWAWTTPTPTAPPRSAPRLRVGLGGGPGSCLDELIEAPRSGDKRRLGAGAGAVLLVA